MNQWRNFRKKHVEKDYADTNETNLNNVEILAKSEIISG